MPTLKQPDAISASVAGPGQSGQPAAGLSASTSTGIAESTTAEATPRFANEIKTLLTHGLDRDERLVVILYYHEKMDVREIALTLDLSEQRVKQIRQSLLSRLRAQLSHYGHLRA